MEQMAEMMLHSMILMLCKDTAFCFEERCTGVETRMLFAWCHTAPTVPMWLLRHLTQLDG